MPADADLTELPSESDVAAVSVAPDRLARVRDVFPRLRIIGESIPLPIAVHYDPPEACGRDRVMAVVGALHRLSGTDGVLVLEAGTCLTATVGSRKRGVIGGAILPGYDLMLSSLAEGTAALPRLEAVPPAALAPGRSTEDSIRVGCWAAQVGAAGELIRRFRAECGFPLRVVAAGTGAGSLARSVGEIDLVHPFATLWGVYLSATAE
jgi:pantothenate kinase type III